MQLPVYNNVGDHIKDVSVADTIFQVAVKPDVIHQVVVAQMANNRQVLADTKDKSEVRGGGKKPWKQKGTGRARHGSIRSPLWKGGGVTFGPTSDRNFSKKVNQKQKQLALFMCLTDRAAHQAVAVFDTVAVTSGKTKDLTIWLKAIQGKIGGLSNAKKFLVVLPQQDQLVVKAARNLKKTKVITADSLNCIDILNHDGLIMSESAVSVIERHYSKRAKHTK